MCTSSASTGLCGGQWVTAVPTATLNITKWLQSRTPPAVKSLKRNITVCRPIFLWGRPLWQRKNQACAICQPS